MSSRLLRLFSLIGTVLMVASCGSATKSGTSDKQGDSGGDRVLGQTSSSGASDNLAGKIVRTEAINKKRIFREYTHEGETLYKYRGKTRVESNGSEVRIMGTELEFPLKQQGSTVISVEPTGTLSGLVEEIGFYVYQTPPLEDSFVYPTFESVGDRTSNEPEIAVATEMTLVPSSNAIRWNGVYDTKVQFFGGKELDSGEDIEATFSRAYHEDQTWSLFVIPIGAPFSSSLDGEWDYQVEITHKKTSQSASCFNGCYETSAKDYCMPGDSIHNCGTDGNRCVACAQGEVCVKGKCQSR